MLACKIISGIIFALIITIELPWIIFWEFCAFFSIFWHMRKYKGQLSFTAVLPLGFRQFLHFFGVRHDPAAHALFRYLPHSPFIPCFMIECALKLALVVSRLGSPNQSKNPVVARTNFFDRELNAFLSSENAEQYVVLGAGFDTRAYQGGLPSKVAVFEVDKDFTQKVKVKALAESRVAHGHVMFVPCDFETEKWNDKLLESGFKPSANTFLLLEGVSYYLTADTFKEILTTVAEFPGSAQIAFDYWLPHKVAAMNRGIMGRFTRDSNEKIFNAFTDEQIVAVVQECGLVVAQHETGKDAGLLTAATVNTEK